MANKFGALTDHFGLVAGASLVLVDSSKVPIANSITRAEDENGDLVEQVAHGNEAGTLYEASSTYAVATDDLDTADIKLGETAAGTVITAVEITTSNGAWPQVTVSGTLGTETMCARYGKLNTYTLPSYTISACKKAQNILFTVPTGVRLTGSGVSASVELAQQEDGEGEPVAHGISGGVIAVTADLLGVTAAPAWVSTALVSAGYAVTQVPGSEEGQAAWHTGSGAAEKILSADVGITTTT